MNRVTFTEQQVLAIIKQHCQDNDNEVADVQLYSDGHIEGNILVDVYMVNKDV